MSHDGTLHGNRSVIDGSLKIERASVVVLVVAILFCTERRAGVVAPFTLCFALGVLFFPHRLWFMEGGGRKRRVLRCREREDAVGDARARARACVGQRPRREVKVKALHACVRWRVGAAVCAQHVSRGQLRR